MLSIFPFSLLTAQKRQACLNEIQRLKAHGASGSVTEQGTGTLTITNTELPLKRDFIAAQLEGKNSDAVHYFLCLLRHGHQVIVTQMVSTDDNVSQGSLHFTNLIQLQNLPPDFSIVFEVYTLQTKKENLPHEKKYHIKREHSKNRLTPKGKKTDGKLPVLSSPGPHAVRSPSFRVVGYTRFNLQNCNKKCFTLDKLPFPSPLEGVLKVKLQLHAEHNVTEKGFLTMFEDVSGFGAWHRRWCSLNGHLLSYWKYPDEESKKNAMGAIDLRQCVTREVRVVPRDICARPHTFQLVQVRPRQKEDRDTLISQSGDTLTTTRRLLSADTKEERERWCARLNDALSNVRQWDPQALAPTQ
ncbi:anillin [Caerostris extrusa]|uniref:Anillin n=1 Tax=Caerostris extrusa TaxID=172846 RepID=A0AAV4URM6_CAEEX|nr:anillin [Caerostris extrusa]